MKSTSSFPARKLPLVFALGLTVGLLACDRGPVEPAASDTSIAADAASDAESAPLEAHGRDDGAVTVPMKIQFRSGSFVVVPSGDPRIPAGTTTDDCPVGEANPELGLPAGFPNGGGVVVFHGTGEATHLGRFEIVQTQCAIQFFPATDPPFVNLDLWSRITGADGSEMFTRGPYATVGSFTPPSVPRPIFDIVGGTGRFEGATGWVPQSVGGEATCTDASGFCLEGTFTGGTTEGELTLPRPGR